MRRPTSCEVGTASGVRLLNPAAQAGLARTAATMLRSPWGLGSFVGLLTTEGDLVPFERDGPAGSSRWAPEPDDVALLVAWVWRTLWQAAELGHPAVEDRVRRSTARCAAGATTRFRERTCAPSGRPLTLDVVLAPLHDTGRVTALVCSVIDVTGSDPAVLDLRRPAGPAEWVSTTASARLPRSHVVPSPFGLLSFVGLLSPAGVLRDGCRTPGRTGEPVPDAWLGQPFWQAPWWNWSPDVGQRLRAAVRLASAGTPSRYHDTALVRGNRLVTVDLAMVPVLTGGTVTALVCAGIDVTETRSPPPRTAAP